MLTNKIPAHLYRIMDSWVTLPENLFSLKFMVFRSGLACQAVMTGVEDVRVRGPLERERGSG